MGSGQVCNGDSCCPGFDLTWGKSFPCPDADPSSYGNCETSNRVDLFNASVFDFGNTEDNKLASADGSEFLLRDVSFYNGVYRDLLIHAEHANGTRANLTDDVVLFYAAYQGKMLVIQLKPYGSVNLRFYMGRMENSVWRPDALPWTVLTFMDLDSGRDWTTFERLTSADHADYVCGEHITAKPHVGDNTVDFETSIPIDSATPTDITLDEDQAKFAIALEFEDKQDFLVSYQNLAWTKRAMFITGITTVNWPELLPAPTPSPTSVPPAHAEGDPHVRTITGLTFDLWKTGWSTFVQIPRSGESSKLLVRGDVRRYGGDACAPSFLYQVHVNGTWLGGHDVSVRAGSLESSDPFSIWLDGGRPLFLQRDAESVLVDESGVRVSGKVGVFSEDWGPDAWLTVKVNSTVLNIVQHTEGRGEISSAMLDVSVAGLDGVEEAVGGWLGVDGALNAGEEPVACRERV